MANPALIGGGRMSRAERSGDTRHFDNHKIDRKQILKRLWAYLGRNRFLLISAVLCAMCGSTLALYSPKLSGVALDAIIGPGQVDFPRVWRCAIMMIICYAVSVALSYLLSFLMVHLSKKVTQQMRHDIFEKLAAMPVGFFDKYQAGEIISTITYDVDTVNQSLSSDVVQILRSVITVTVSFIMMLTIAPVLVLVFVVTVPTTFFFTKWITARVRPLFRARSAKLGELNGFVEEMLQGQKTVRAYGREDAVLEHFDEKNNDAVEAYTKAESNGTTVGPSVNFINNLSLSAVCVFGSLVLLRGKVTIGQLSSFIQYSRKFSGPINEFANIIAELQSAFAAAERIFMLIDGVPEKPDSEDAVTLTDVRGDVELKDVDFSYDEGHPIITGLNLRAKPGSLTAIVGPTGAGKTTIINLLMRFYDVNAGTVTVDGTDVRHITRSSLRKAYSMVLQETWLFHGTIYDNIAYGKPGATMEDVVAAAKAAHIHNYISRLPKGYDTVLSDNGSSISKGQKQLMTIARAMLLDAHMLILDEATSNVDTRTEQKIQAAMRELMKGKTCFVIAHRLSTIQSADNILVLNRGQVVEQGNHESLMAQRGFYYKLYQSQFDAVE